MTDIIGGESVGYFDSNWANNAVIVIRSMIGDLDPSNYSYSNERLLQVFLAASNLVMLDSNYAFDYEVNIFLEEITPDPSTDYNFLALTSLKASCILLSSELRSKGTSRVTMKDGPSEISMDNSSSLSSLKDLSSSICKKYEDSMFQFRAGISVGVAILGPYSPGSVSAGRNTESDNSRNTYY
jgi:hypothetical protein